MPFPSLYRPLLVSLPPCLRVRFDSVLQFLFWLYNIRPKNASGRRASTSKHLVKRCWTVDRPVKTASIAPPRVFQDHQASFSVRPEPSRSRSPPKFTFLAALDWHPLHAQIYQHLSPKNSSLQPSGRILQFLILSSTRKPITSHYSKFCPIRTTPRRVHCRAAAQPCPASSPSGSNLSKRSVWSHCGVRIERVEEVRPQRFSAHCRVWF